MELRESGGEGGIRTLGTGVSPYNGLANRRLQPLGHLSSVCLPAGSSILTKRETQIWQLSGKVGRVTDALPRNGLEMNG